MDEQPIPVATPISPPQPPPAPAAGGRAVAALILGILSIVCAGFVTGIPAIILGRMELTAIKKGLAPAAGESSAKVGFILGIIGTVLTCLSIVGFILLIGVSLGSNPNPTLFQILIFVGFIASIVLTFLIYGKAMKWVTIKFKLEKHIPQLFKGKKK